MPLYSEYDATIGGVSAVSVIGAGGIRGILLAVVSFPGSIMRSSPGSWFRFMIPVRVETWRTRSRLYTTRRSARKRGPAYTPLPTTGKQSGIDDIAFAQRGKTVVSRVIKRLLSTETSYVLRA